MLIRLLLASGVCLALAACGGGASPSPFPNPGGPVAPSGLSSQSVQQTDVQAGLSGVNAARNLVGGGAGAILIEHRIAPVLRSLLAHRAAPSVTCDNGTSESITGSNTAGVITIDEYYDATCTQIESSLVWTETETSSSFSGPATETMYSTSGSVTQTDQLQVNVDLASPFADPNVAPIISGFSMLTTSMRGANGNQLGEAGLACSTISSVTCGVATALNGSSGEYGANVSATAKTGTTTSLNMQIQSYHANVANALSIAAATFPDWSISPASDLTQTLSLTGSANSTQLSFTVTDATNGGTVTVTGLTAGTITGSLTATSGGPVVASFTIDQNGDGSVTFGNGTAATIADYAIQG